MLFRMINDMYVHFPHNQSDKSRVTHMAEVTLV